MKIDDAREALSTACGDVGAALQPQCNSVTLLHIVGELKQGGGKAFIGGEVVDRADLAAFGERRRVGGGGGGGGGGGALDASSRCCDSHCSCDILQVF
jgi:hypothetical protein